MKKSKIILLSLFVFILILLIGLIIALTSLKDSKKPIVKTAIDSGVRIEINLTEENIPFYLSSNQIVNELPEDALISLKTSSEEYVVTKSSVKQGIAENPDITLTLPSSYLQELGNNFCGTLIKARNNGDLSIELHVTKLSAGWKYSGLYKYKDCLGM
jgi:hypothetical protein